MSVQELFDLQGDFKAKLGEWMAHPKAWLLQANPVWGSWETCNMIALFDTREQAKAYLEASMLPKVDDPERHETKDGYGRSFRPDSLLWDYNLEIGSRPMIVPADPLISYDRVRWNPLPPSGEIAGDPREWSPRGILQALDLETKLPKYGRDFDQGFSPKSNMDHVVPQAPPLESKAE